MIVRTIVLNFILIAFTEFTAAKVPPAALADNHNKSVFTHRTLTLFCIIGLPDVQDRLTLTSGNDAFLLPENPYEVVLAVETECIPRYGFRQPTGTTNTPSLRV